jgi:aminoglycoside phosphotransferase (APT) family kinase protein
VVKLHPDEIEVDVALVRSLIEVQFPQWSELPLKRVVLRGTDHALFRVGEDMVARIPIIDWAADQADSDARWLPILEPHLPLSIPVPLVVGEPGEGFPWRWTVAPWLPGDNPTRGNFDMLQAASDLAGFIKALRGISTTGGPVKTSTFARGVPLAMRDQPTRRAIEECGDRIDTSAATAAWEDALDADSWAAPGVWVHGDLEAGNLIAADGRLAAVIDWGPLNIGDPAVDLMGAWSLFDKNARDQFSAEVDCDEATWRRGRGWALSTGLIGVPYYWKTHPDFVALALGKIRNVVADFD